MFSVNQIIFDPHLKFKYLQNSLFVLRSMSDLQKKLSFALLPSIMSYTTTTLDICFLALMRNINEISKGDEIKVVKLYSNVLVGMYFSRILTCFLVSHLISKIGPLKALDIQLFGILISKFLIIFFPSYRTFLILYMITNTFLNYDISIQALIAWVPIEDYADLTRKHMMIQFIIQVLAPLIGTRLLTINKEYTWQIFFGADFLIFAATLFYFKISFLDFEEPHFLTPNSPENRPQADNYKNFKVFVRKVKEKSIASWTRRLKRTTTRTIQENEIKSMDFDLPKENDLLLGNSEPTSPAPATKPTFFSHVLQSIRNLLQIRITRILLISHIFLYIIALHPERLIFQWLEIKLKDGGLEIKASSIGLIKTLSSIFSLLLFFSLFPYKQNGSKTFSLLKLSCFTQFFVFAVLPFARYLSQSNKLVAYFGWNMLNQTFIAMLWGLTSKINNFFIPVNLLAQFFSIVKFITYTINIVMFYFLARGFTWILTNERIDKSLGEMKTSIVFLPFGILCFIIYFLNLTLDLTEFVGKKGEGDKIIIKSEVQHK